MKAMRPAHPCLSACLVAFLLVQAGCATSDPSAPPLGRFVLTSVAGAPLPGRLVVFIAGGDTLGSEALADTILLTPDATYTRHCTTLLVSIFATLIDSTLGSWRVSGETALSRDSVFFGPANSGDYVCPSVRGARRVGDRLEARIGRSILERDASVFQRDSVDVVYRRVP